MNINIKYTNLDSTPAIEEYIVDKFGSLKKFIPRLNKKMIPQMQVEVSRSSKQRKGDVYRIECNLKLPGRLLRAEADSWDARLGIDACRDTMDREIRRYKSRTRPQDSSGQQKLRKLRGK